MAAWSDSGFARSFWPSGTLAPAYQHIKAGTLRGLAVTGTKRWKDLPEIPEDVREDLVFVPVESMDQVLEFALDRPAPAPSSKRPDDDHEL